MCFFPQRFGSLERIGTRKIDQVEVSSHVWSSDLVGRNSLRPSPRNCDLFKALIRLDTVPIRFLSLAFYFPRLSSPFVSVFCRCCFFGVPCVKFHEPGKRDICFAGVPFFQPSLGFSGSLSRGSEDGEPRKHKVGRLARSWLRTFLGHGLETILKPGATVDGRNPFRTT